MRSCFIFLQEQNYDKLQYGCSFAEFQFHNSYKRSSNSVMSSGRKKVSNEHVSASEDGPLDMSWVRDWPTSRVQTIINTIDSTIVVESILLQISIKAEKKNGFRVTQRDKLQIWFRGRNAKQRGQSERLQPSNMKFPQLFQLTLMLQHLFQALSHSVSLPL